MELNLPTKAHAKDFNVVIGEDGDIVEYKFNLGELLVVIENLIADIEGDVVNMPTHENISSILKRAVGYA